MITVERLRECLDYDPATGLFKRLINTSSRWKAGLITGSKHRDCESIRFDGKSYRAHRLAWFYMTGDWPPHEVDHINMNPHDNRWSNLRLATRSQNGANKRAYSTNTSGLKGVAWHKRGNKWRATVGRKHIGLFDCPAAAHFAYIVAADGVYGKFSRAA